jgi:drug/metabolite transporter (DMT)-like permease
MSVLVCFWGLEYIIAKTALEVFDPLSLIFFKYFIGCITLLAVKLVIDRKWPLNKRQIPLLVLCVIFGDILYYFGEYSALSYLSVAVVTILLSFVPVLSVIIERVVFNKSPSFSMVVGIFACIAGVALVIGVDFSHFKAGKIAGYALVCAAVVSWNVYNFLTMKLSASYKSLDLTLYQLICTVILLLPYIIGHLPDPVTLTAEAVGGVVYLGVVSSAMGFFIYVKSISVIGATPCALFSTFMPVTAAFFGWLILGETLTWMQIFGGIVVVVSACVVISRKRRLELREAAEM